MYLLVFHTYINEMHGSRRKVPSKKSRPYIYDVKFLALLGATYIYDISRLRVKFIHRLATGMQTAHRIQLSALSKLRNRLIVWILKTQRSLFITITVQKI
jgi:hypothetical protein